MANGVMDMAYNAEGGGLGRRQRNMLVDMHLWGVGGCYPSHWMMLTADYRVMGALYKRGLVTDTGRMAALTDEGRRIAEELNRRSPTEGDTP